MRERLHHAGMREPKKPFPLQAALHHGVYHSNRRQTETACPSGLCSLPCAAITTILIAQFSLPTPHSLSHNLLSCVTPENPNLSLERGSAPGTDNQGSIRPGVVVTPITTPSVSTLVLFSWFSQAGETDLLPLSTGACRWSVYYSVVQFWTNWRQLGEPIHSQLCIRGVGLARHGPTLNHHVRELF